MLTALQGKKTYIVAGLLALVQFLHMTGQINDTDYNAIMTLLGSAGLATLAAKINRLRNLLPLLFVLLFPTVLFAQSNWSLSWNQPNATPAEALDYIYKLTIDSQSPVTLTPTCTAINNVTQCKVPRPVLSSGSHTLTLTAENGFGISPPAILNGRSPDIPVSFTLIITIVVP